MGFKSLTSQSCLSKEMFWFSIITASDWVHKNPMINSWQCLSGPGWTAQHVADETVTGETVQWGVDNFYEMTFPNNLKPFLDMIPKTIRKMAHRIYVAFRKSNILLWFTKPRALCQGFMISLLQCDPEYWLGNSLLMHLLLTVNEIYYKEVLAIFYFTFLY